MTRKDRTEYENERSVADPEGFQQAVLSWYWSHRRSMPWRENPLPYYIWISEIMLQQTRVETVIPYFERFIRRYPDIPSLAASPEDELLKYWEGLGYYQRVRNLRTTALELVANHGGRLPETYGELLRLKGIGEYTAGAIASEAFGKKVAAVDGNVFRVMARLTGCEEDIRDRRVMNRLRERTEELLPDENTGDFNQGLIELGALICIPKGSPKCGICPVKRHCSAYERDIQDMIPLRSRNKDRRVEERTVLLFQWENRFSVSRRKDGILLGGLYEIPNEEGFYDQEEVLSLSENLGAQVISIEELKERKFLFTHIEWRLKGYLMKIREPHGDYIFETLEELKKNYTLATVFRGYLEEIEDPRQETFL